MYYIGYLDKNLEKMMVFRSDEIPTKTKYGFFAKVVGPYESKEEAGYAARTKRRQHMRNPGKAKYCRERQLSPSLFDPKSFRTITLGKGKKGVIGCRKKHFHSGKCSEGTRLQTILHPEGSGRCPRGAGGRELRKRNPERVISHRQALALTKKIIRFAQKLYKHERHGIRYENPGASYHAKKFVQYMKELDRHMIGSKEYISTLAKAYEHLESERVSREEGI